jgi:hypothetical protein
MISLKLCVAALKGNQCKPAVETLNERVHFNRGQSGWIVNHDTLRLDWRLVDNRR